MNDVELWVLESSNNDWIPENRTMELELEGNVCLLPNKGK